jgi:glucokinase
VKEIFAGIDIGGTGTRFVAYGHDGLSAQITMATADLAVGDSDVKLSRLASNILKIVPADRKLVGVGIGASGPVDRDQGVIHNPDTLPGFTGIRLVAGLERLLGLPVTIENDAMVAAIAEQRVGAGKHASRMLMLTLGTGIGVALVLDGKPFRGLHGAHPEASHFPIMSDGDGCYCGIQGCWENLASRSALQRMLRPHLPSTIADREVVGQGAKHASEEYIREIFFNYGALLGRGLLALEALYMPDVLVLGGGAADQFDLFMPGLRASMAKSNHLVSNLEIKAGALGDIAGAIGAAIVARDAVNLALHSC